MSSIDVDELSAASEAAYRKAAGGVLKRVEARGLAITVETLLAELRRLGERAASTWRQIRAALRWWLAKHRGPAEAQSFTDSFAELALPRRKPPRPRRTLPDAMMWKAVHALEARPTKNRLLAADLLIATVITGLRPSEWASARLEHTRLTVRNAKFREGYRANGEERELYIDLDALSNRERLAITRCVERMRGFNWTASGDMVRRHIRDAFKRLTRSRQISARAKRTRLYDARHQFASDAKQSLNFTAGEVAAAMGHISAMTAYAHYGRARSTSRKSAVAPSIESVDRVRPKSITTLLAKLSKAAAVFKTFSQRNFVSQVADAGPQTSNPSTSKPTPRRA